MANEKVFIESEPDVKGYGGTLVSYGAYVYYIISPDGNRTGKAVSYADNPRVYDVEPGKLAYAERDPSLIAIGPEYGWRIHLPK